MKLFIADDEIDVCEGIRYLLDWDELGFHICGEARNGQDALEQILKLSPDVVLLDISMPKLSGTEVIEAAVKQGFKGKFIILSGYSDFSFAQQVMRYGVSSYLTKPIDEDILEKVIIETKESILNEQDTQKKFAQYRDKARDSILQDILCNRADYLFLDYHDMMLESSVYQVVLYTNYSQEAFQTTWDFAGILRLANKNHNSLDYVQLDNQNVIILKDNFAIERFNELLEHHISQPQKGSPLDSLFLTYGRPVYSVEEIHISFQDAKQLMNRRFFCMFNQHVIGYKGIPQDIPADISVDFTGNNFSERIANYIKSCNHHMLPVVLDELQNQLYYADMNIDDIKHFLADIMIQVKSILAHAYKDVEIPLPSNREIISDIEKKYYLYEIMQFYTAQFEKCMNIIGTPTKSSIIDGILQYIQHNYQENLKLNTIAELFGYNSSYLGKIFNKETGKSFNSYIDEVRIENSKKLLLDNNYKVYEISQMVGYTNVDYFHKKFKKYVDMSPAEFRKSSLEEK